MHKGDQRCTVSRIELFQDLVLTIGCSLLCPDLVRLCCSGMLLQLRKVLCSTFQDVSNHDRKGCKQARDCRTNRLFFKLPSPESLCEENLVRSPGVTSQTQRARQMMRKHHILRHT